MPDSSGIPKPFRLPEALWERLATLLPPERPKPRGGRPRADARRCLEAILFVLKTGIQWKALPRGIAAASTAHDRFQEWTKAGVFAEAWDDALHLYDQEVGIDWRWQSMDGSLTKAPLGGETTGPNPTDRGKCGVKRSVLVEGHGIPLAVVAAPANRHDSKLTEPTLEARRILPPLVSQHLCLDKGYDTPAVRSVARAYLFTPHIRPIGEEPRRMERNRKRRARRWTVERIASWLNRFRRLLIRWEKKVANYLALLHFACAWVTYHASGLW